MPYKSAAPKILNAIQGANHILLISHEKPDGDTLGSALALAQFLTKGKKEHKHYPNYQPQYPKDWYDYRYLYLPNCQF